MSLVIRLCLFTIFITLDFSTYAQEECAILESKEVATFLTKSSGTCSYSSDCYGPSSPCRDCNLSTTGCVWRIPLQFSIITNTQGDGSITDSEIETVLQFMNEAYGFGNIEFFQADPPRRGGNLVSNALYNIDENSMCGGANEEQDLEALMVVNVMNIFITGAVRRCGNNYSGMAYMPGGPQRLTLSNQYFPSVPSIIAHEMGHVLGLFHTHRDYNNSNAELSNGSNCATAGDMICDTPADPRLNIDQDGNFCQVTDPDCDCNKANPYTSICPGLDPCAYNGNGNFNPDMDNLMGYNPWLDCPRNRFTQCQFAKMQDVLTECHSNFCDDPFPPSVDQPDSIILGETLPILTANIVANPMHSASCVNWYDAPSGGNLLLANSRTFPLIYGQNTGQINGDGTYYYWAEGVSPYNSSCTSNRVQVQFVVQPTSASTTANIDARLFLQGPYNTSTGTMSNRLRADGLLPTQQPFNTSPWYYDGTEGVSNLNNIPSNAVDWILLEVRDGKNIGDMVGRKAAFLLDNGRIMDMNGNYGATFQGLDVNETYYLVIRARGHLPIISEQAIVPNSSTPYDFTKSNKVKGGSVIYLGNSRYGLYAGDFNGDGAITVYDFNKYLNEVSQFNDYLDTDCNLDKATTVIDFNLFYGNSSVFGVGEVRY